MIAVLVKNDFGDIAKRLRERVDTFSLNRDSADFAAAPLKWYFCFIRAFMEFNEYIFFDVLE